MFDVFLSFDLGLCFSQTPAKQPRQNTDGFRTLIGELMKRKRQELTNYTKGIAEKQSNSLTNNIINRFQPAFNRLTIDLNRLVISSLPYFFR